MMESVNEIANVNRSFEENFSLDRARKKQAAKTFFNNAGIIIGVFLTFVAAVTTFTDIKITSVKDVAYAGMRYFVLLFVTYQMYVNTADSGSRRGFLTEAYISAREKYENCKAKILNSGLQNKLPAFCTEYIKRELKNTRTVIVATIGMSYSEFEPYLKLDKKNIKKDASLSRTQKKIIIKAMKVKPIHLTPEMIMQLGLSGKRSPLGINPAQKKLIVFGWKFLTTAITTFFVISLAFEIIAKPTVETWLYTLASIVPVVLNGFGGYKFGYENIAFDTVEFTNAQSALIEEFVAGEGEK